MSQQTIPGPVVHAQCSNKPQRDWRKFETIARAVQRRLSGACSDALWRCQDHGHRRSQEEHLCLHRDNITIDTIGVLLLPSPRAAFLGRASDARLRDVIAQLFRRNARVGSGSAMDAFRFEQRTGVLLSPSGHGLKLFERRTQLQRLLRNQHVLPEDRLIVKALLIDIQNALSGQ